MLRAWSRTVVLGAEGGSCNLRCFAAGPGVAFERKERIKMPWGWDLSSWNRGVPIDRGGRSALGGRSVCLVLTLISLLDTQEQMDVGR